LVLPVDNKEGAVGFGVDPFRRLTTLRHVCAVIYQCVATGKGPLFVESNMHNTIYHNPKMGPNHRDQVRKMAVLLFQNLGMSSKCINIFVLCLKQMPSGTRLDPQMVEDMEQASVGSTLLAHDNFNERPDRQYHMKVFCLYHLSMSGKPGWDYHFPKDPRHGKRKPDSSAGQVFVRKRNKEMKGVDPEPTKFIDNLMKDAELNRHHKVHTNLGMLAGAAGKVSEPGKDGDDEDLETQSC
jgi:hypothetical protein